MAESAERIAGRLLSSLVKTVLRNPSAEYSVEALAAKTGYSRFHLARMFEKNLRERPSCFVRRIRLERSAWLLVHTERSIGEIGEEAGYAHGSGFTRAFVQAWGNGPQAHRETGKEWKLESPSGIHWNPLWAEPEDEVVKAKTKQFPTLLGLRPATSYAVRQVVGNYQLLGQRWAELAESGCLPMDRECLTLFIDNAWTYPESSKLRADIGFLLRDGEQVPSGWRRLDLPSGLYSTLANPIPREQRNEGWLVASGKWPGATWAFDTYDRPPVPWDDALTRIWLSAF
ncbi:MAG: helix-turn-helix domain-containing protein [Fimbriimonadaceae bacterium]|nr:helix-turn-helix domain-containing protein [Fimbriimonadaceae bacterium]